MAHASLAQVKGYEHVVVFFKGRVEATQAVSEDLILSHKEFVQKQHKAGNLLVSGPFEGGGGLAIFKVLKIEAIDSILSLHRGVEKRQLQIERYYWKQRIGNLCSINGEMEFVPYTFVKFDTYITKFNVRLADDYFKLHDDFIKALQNTGNVVSEGEFSNSDGNTLILKGNVTKEVIMSDPVVGLGFMIPTIKKVWLPNGIFCKH